MSTRIATAFGEWVLNILTDFMDDEAAIAMACEDMMSMVGNPGQATLIGDHLEDFADWAWECLEVFGADYTYDYFRSLVINDWYGGDVQKWEGTDIIWGYGYQIIADNAGYHDSADEMGEGTGGY